MAARRGRTTPRRALVLLALSLASAYACAVAFLVPGTYLDPGPLPRGAFEQVIRFTAAVYATAAGLAIFALAYFTLGRARLRRAVPRIVLPPLAASILLSPAGCFAPIVAFVLAAWLVLAYEEPGAHGGSASSASSTP